MVDFSHASPILPVSDLAAAVEHYRRLGFEVTSYQDRYAFAQRGRVEVHLSPVDQLDPATSQVSLYLYIDDADALAAEWSGAPGRLVPPVDTEYGLREGAHVDPDGNLVRFGARLVA